MLAIRERQLPPTSNPAELPAEFDTGGGSGVFRPRPNPELPVFQTNFSNDLINELVQSRLRIHELEIAQLIARLRPPRGPGPGPQELPAFSRAARFLPNELPEGGEGGGGGVFPRPGEINELPIDFSRFFREISQLSTRLSSLESIISAQAKELVELKARKG